MSALSHNDRNIDVSVIVDRQNEINMQIV